MLSLRAVAGDSLRLTDPQQAPVSQFQVRAIRRSISLVPIRVRCDGEKRSIFLRSQRYASTQLQVTKRCNYM